MRYAILDLGTNTFNLLIAETSEENLLQIIHTSKEPVRLGQGGINDHKITEKAFSRGITAIERHYRKINTYGAGKIYAYATSAIRDAHNGKDFLNEVDHRFDLYINIIPGDREAELIYKGVRQSYKFERKRVLILDIGGGSNEFIIADNKRIYWKYSFDLGMARLLEKFNPSDPITREEVEKIEEYLDRELTPLYQAARQYHPKVLIGASGAFETFSALLAGTMPERYHNNGDYAREIYINDYRELHDRLLSSTHDERKNLQGMEPVRVDMIVLATIFVNFTIGKCDITRFIQSDFSLKEGVMAEILNI